jgi:predicted ATPase/DNA-binding SARP family transcriptional activator
MDVGVLGPLEVHARGRTVEVAGARQRALLAALVAHRGRTVTTDLLVDTLWPHEPPPSAAHTLHTHVSRLRRTLDLPLLARDGGYALDLPAGAVDAERFDAWLTQAEHADPVGAVELLGRALGLWRGSAYASAADLSAVRAEARRLEERRTLAREALVARLVQAGRPTDAVTHAESLVADEPTRESAWTALVHALVSAGRPADGTAAFRRASAALDELGLVPSTALRTAHARALRGDRPAPGEGTTPAGAVAPAPPSAPRRSDVVPPDVHRLEDTRPGARAPVTRGGTDPTTQGSPGRSESAVPVPVTSLVGRQDDVAAVQRLLLGARLVTLVGPGGVGKTRLALEVARQVADAHASGCRVLELGTLADAATLTTAVLGAVGLTAQGGADDAALRRLGALDVLVVLDNCEHLVDAVAELVEQLLVGGRAQVLATSRERLGVPGEHVLVVEPLATTPERPAARTLFVERARAAGGLGAEPFDLALVDRVVQGLDGLPLAIEMAAARAAGVGLPELAAMLGEADLAARHGEADAVVRPGEPDPASPTHLRNPHRSAPARHRSLAAVVAWSEDLLDPPERATLTGWPVFSGPVEAADAEAVLGASRASVEALVHRSLLVPQPDALSTPTRYRMLRTVRSAVLERGVGALPRARHAAHVLGVAAGADAALRGPHEAVAVARLGGLVAELRTAHAWAREHDVSLAATLSAALHVLAVSTLDDEVLGWAARLVPHLDDGDPRLAPAHAGVAAHLTQAGQLTAAAARARRALALDPEPRVRLAALEVLADAAIYDGQLTLCGEIAGEMTDVALACGDAHYLAMATGSACLALAYGGDPGGAHRELARRRTLLHERFDPLSPTALGWLAYTEAEIDLDADPSGAAAGLRRAVSLADSVGNRYLGGVARVSATSVAARHGDPGEALVSFEGVIRWWLERGDRTHLVTTLRNLVDVLRRLDAPAAAAELLGAVSGTGVSQTFGAERALLDAARERLAGVLGEAQLAELAARGAARDVEEAARTALDAARVLRGR